MKGEIDDGVKHQLSLHFVKTGIISTDMSRFYSQLFNDRITGDYDDFAEYDLPTAEIMYGKAKEFVAAMKALI